MIFKILIMIIKKDWKLTTTVSTLEFSDREDEYSLSGDLRIASSNFSFVILVPDFSTIQEVVQGMAREKIKYLVM